MTLEHSEIVAVKINLGGIHGHVGGKMVIIIVCALNDIFGPGVVMVAGAIAGAGHLTITGVVVTAVAQGEAVGPVGAQKVIT